MIGISAALPEKYEYDYLVYMVSESLEDETRNWDIELFDIYKRLIFRRFESWVQEKYIKAKEKNG